MMNCTIVFSENEDAIFFSAINPETSDAEHLSREDKIIKNNGSSFLGQGNKIFLITRNKPVLHTSCPVNSHYSETENIPFFYLTYTKKIEKYFSKQK